MTEMQELAERLLGGPNDDALFIRRIRNEAAEAILTLERERDEAREARDVAIQEMVAQAKACGETEARATAAEAQVQALREALEPFAKAADDGEGMLRDGGYPFPADDAPAGYEQRHGGYVQMTPLWGHLRRARAALRSEP